MTFCLPARVLETVRRHLSFTRAHRGTIPLLVALAIALPLSILASRPAVAGAPVFFSIQPGTANKALVDLTMGEPLAKLDEEGAYEYAPPREAPEAAQLVIRYFPDLIVSRLDVFLRQPMSAADLKSGFGNMVISRERPDGRREEFFYPSLQGIIYEKGAESPVLAISFLSPRFVADIYCERFNELYGAKKYQEAGVEGDKAVLVDPDYARGYLAQGLYYDSQKNFDEALVRYNAAIAAKYTPEKKARAYMLMGGIYSEEKNQPDKAAEAYRKSVETDPHLAVAHVEYAQFLIKQKKEDQALAQLRLAVEGDPSDIRAKTQLAGFFFDRRKYAEALPLYKELSEWADSPAAAQKEADLRSEQHFNYAYCLAEAGKREEAIKWYEKAIALNPKGDGAFNNLGYQYLQLGSPVRAEEVLRRGLQVNPGNLLLNGNLVDAIIMLDRPEEAVRQADTALALKPADSGLMIKMARAQAALWKKKKGGAFLGMGGSEEKDKAERWLEEAARAGYKGDVASDPLLREIIKGNEKLEKLFLRK